MALNVEPFQFDPAAAARASNPNRRRKWLIPLVLAAQVRSAAWALFAALGGGSGGSGGSGGNIQSAHATAVPALPRGRAALKVPPLNRALVEDGRLGPALALLPCRPRCSVLTLALSLPPAQVALKLLLDRVLDEDGCRGDNNGPFDEQTVKERREELKRDKVGGGGGAGGWGCGWGGPVLQRGGTRTTPSWTVLCPPTAGGAVPRLTSKFVPLVAPLQEERKRKAEQRKKKAAASSAAATSGGWRHRTARRGMGMEKNKHVQF